MIPFLTSFTTVAVLLVSLLFSLAPHSLATEIAPIPPIKIAFNTWIGYSSFYIAQKEGLFSKYGLTVETTVIDPLADKNAAMLRGDLTGMGGTIDSSVISTTGGLSASIVMMFDRSNGTDGILATENIKTVKDLIGKSIAVEEGFVGHFFLLYVLEKAGLRPDVVRLIPMTTDEAGVAFAAGKVDVAVTWQPYLSTALTRPGSHVLVSSAELEPILADTLFISKTFIVAHPEAVHNLISALMQANDEWKKHPDAYLGFISDKWQIKKDDVISTMKTVELYDCAAQLRLFGVATDGPLYSYVDTASHLWRLSGITTSSPTSAALIDPTFVRSVCHVQ